MLEPVQLPLMQSPLLEHDVPFGQVAPVPGPVQAALQLPQLLVLRSSHASV